MDREPHRQGRQLGAAGQSDCGARRRRAGRVALLTHRAGARGHAGQPRDGRHRVDRAAVDRRAAFAPQDAVSSRRASAHTQKEKSLTELLLLC